MSALGALGLVLLGFAVGTLGTLVGAGGGFLLIPVLVLLHPNDSAAILTATSLTVVCVNATSGSIAYARMRRIDVRAGMVFVLAGLPGALLGAWATAHLARRVFDPLLGVVLLIGGGAIFLRPAAERHIAHSERARTLVEKDGTVHVYEPRVLLGAVLSSFVGFLSSLLGIGGGILHVPAMVYLLGFPTHIATATSHFVLAFLSLAGVLVHVGMGGIGEGFGRALPISAGALAGAPLGAWFSSRIQGRWILRALAVALASVGLRLLLLSAPHP
jgi:uncharacterized membrane protein YfcA